MDMKNMEQKVAIMDLVNTSNNNKVAFIYSTSTKPCSKEENCE